MVWTILDKITTAEITCENCKLTIDPIMHAFTSVIFFI